MPMQISLAQAINTSIRNFSSIIGTTSDWWALFQHNYLLPKSYLIQPTTKTPLSVQLWCDMHHQYIMYPYGQKFTTFYQWTKYPANFIWSVLEITYETVQPVDDYTGPWKSLFSSCQCCARDSECHWFLSGGSQYGAKCRDIFAVVIDVAFTLHFVTWMLCNTELHVIVATAIELQIILCPKNRRVDITFSWIRKVVFLSKLVRCIIKNEKKKCGLATDQNTGRYWDRVWPERGSRGCRGKLTQMESFCVRRFQTEPRLAGPTYSPTGAESQEVRIYYLTRHEEKKGSLQKYQFAEINF